MSSISKTDQLSARVSVKVPQPDSLVEVRVTPPDSNFQIKVSPGEDVIELLIQPGSSMVEVRISPPGEKDSERLAGQFRLPSAAHFQPEDQDDGEEVPGQGEEAGAPAGDEVLPGLSRAEFAAMVEEEESAEAKKLLDQMAEDEEEAAKSRTSPGYQLSDEVKERLASDEDDEEELNRLDELLSPEEAPLKPEEDQAAEVLPEEAPEEAPAEEPAAETEEEADEEPAVEGPSPDELAAADAEAAPAGAEAEAADSGQPTVAGPTPDELAEAAEPDELDLPEADEEAAPAEAPADLSIAEPDEFDLPEPDEATLVEAPADLSIAEPDEFDLPEPDEATLVEAPADLSIAEPDEFDLPEPDEATLVEEAAPAEAVEPDKPGPPAEDPLGALTLENNETPAETRAAAPAPTEASASQTLEWVPVNPGGTPIEEEEPIDPQVIGAAARDALARLNQAVEEEQAAIEAVSLPAAKPPSGEATAAATSLSSADSTIMVEMYDDYEPGPNPADTITPPPEDELMDLSQVEKDEDLAIEPIDVDGLGELDLEKSHFADSGNGAPTIKARPMVQVIPGNTVVPE